MEIHTPEPLVPEPGLFGVKITIAKLKRHKFATCLLNSGRTDSGSR
jgi:hypothetical protein